MHTFRQLKEGELKGISRLKISEGLKTFPNEIFDLAETLEILDLSGNQISQLPEDFHKLQNLRILFLSQNQFTSFPTVLTGCPKLEMIGFKSNQITDIPENAIPTNTRWLILTDNKITTLPKSIGKCPRLQKVMFAGNQLQSLPDEMAACKNIELLRISANQFQSFPDWLFDLPKLSWLALAGNPIFDNAKYTHPTIEWQHFNLAEKLGEGTSGVVHKAILKRPDDRLEEVVVKVYKNIFSSDGWTRDEMYASMGVPSHPNLIHGLGVIPNHPENKMALVISAVPPQFKSLGLTPTFESCTRDVFEGGKSFTSTQIKHIVAQMASAAFHLHENKINHGDLYAHNTLIEPLQNKIYLGDYGAACRYDALPKHQSERLEKIEVRSFGSFIDDLLTIVSDTEKDSLNFLEKLRNKCFQTEVLARPSFREIVSYF